MHETSVSPDTIRDTLMAAQGALDIMHDSLRTMRNCIDETRQQLRESRKVLAYADQRLACHASDERAVDALASSSRSSSRPRVPREDSRNI
jgi:hypothetical protein